MKAISIYKTLLCIIASGMLSACQVAMNRSSDLTSLLSSSLTSSSSTSVVASTVNSTITGTGPAFADGVNTSTIAISLRSETNVAVVGVVPTFTATDTGGDNVYGTCSATNSAGAASCTLASSTAEVKTLSIATPISDVGDTVTFTTPSLDLESSIDMVDVTVGSKSAVPRNIANSLVQIDASWFDGAITWEAEVVATNIDSASKNITITDYTNGDAVMATVPVPSGTTTATRIRATFSATPSGVATYRVQTPSTTTDNDVTVYTVRIIVKQVGAAKTAIYFPLAQGLNSTVLVTSAGIDTTTSTTYGYLSSARRSVYKKNTSYYSKLVTSNPWQFMAVIGNGGSTGNSAYAALYNAAQNTEVSGTEVSYSGGTNGPILATADIADSATNFTNTETFAVKIKTSNAAATATLYKAGLWLKLDNLTKARTFYRLSRAEILAATSYLEYGRAKITTGNCENAAYHADILGEADSSSGYTISVYDNSTQDTIAASTPVIIAASTVTLQTTLDRTLTSDFTSSIVNNDRLIVRAEKTAGNASLYSAFLTQDCTGDP